MEKNLKKILGQFVETRGDFTNETFYSLSLSPFAPYFTARQKFTYKIGLLCLKVHI